MKTLCASAAIAMVILGSGLQAKAEETNNEVEVKNLFLQQLKQPEKAVSIGFTYWIELNRAGKSQRVTNRFAFKSGDRIRFHVKPNVTGYAYIVMLQGSDGAQAVLFPGKNSTVNKITAGQTMVLPSGKDMYLGFDNTSGLETLRLAFSKTPIDPKKQLQSTSPVLLASKPANDKNTIPEAVTVSEDSSPEPKNLNLEEWKKPEATGNTTIVSRTPGKMLSVDIALDHQ